MKLLDTNYILRFLLRDNEDMFEAAGKVIKNDQCFILEGVLAEVVYVLHGVYNVPRNEISNTLIQFISLDTVFTRETKTVFIDALTLYQSKKLDYMDCVLCALKDRYTVKSFDKKLMQCVNLP